MRARGKVWHERRPMPPSARAVAVRTAMALLATLAGANLAACSTGSDVDSGSPPEQCRDFVSAYCAKMTECALPSDRSRASADCAFSFEVNLSCDDVIAIHGSMQACLDALMATPCTSVDPPGSWPTVPSRCKLLETR